MGGRGGGVGAWGGGGGGGGGAQWANLDLQAVKLNLYFESIDTQMDPIQCDHFSPLPMS